MTVGAKMPTPKKKPPTEDQYEKAEIQTALSFCPPIEPCCKCGWPYVDGYQCGYCGDESPSVEPESPSPAKLSKEEAEKKLVEFVKAQKDLPSDIQKILDDNFWGLI
jgi:hypothetical protein